VFFELDLHGQLLSGVRPQRMSGLISRAPFAAVDVFSSDSEAPLVNASDMPSQYSLRRTWLKPNGSAVPAPAADNYGAVEDETLVVPWMQGVLANDEGPAKYAVLAETTAHGLLVLRDDGSFDYTPNANFNREDAFRYRASDGDNASDPATVTITVQTQRPWYNGLQPLDVSDDTFVLPIDALLTINELNGNGSYRLPMDRPRPLTAPFYDVSRDGLVSPIDALLVINYLNGTFAEGEAAGGLIAETAASGVSLLLQREAVVFVPTEPTRVTEPFVWTRSGRARDDDRFLLRDSLTSLDLLFACYGSRSCTRPADSWIGCDASNADDLAGCLEVLFDEDADGSELLGATTL